MIFTTDLKKSAKLLMNHLANLWSHLLASRVSGKSYFLNRVFDQSILTKDSKTLSRGTIFLNYSQLPEFHLLDMEGLDSSKGDLYRDVFNFFSIMTISDVVLLHISHHDLEDIKFIKEFGFMLYQAFSSSKSTCFLFRLDLPKFYFWLRTHDGIWRMKKHCFNIKFLLMILKIRLQMKWEDFNMK